MKHFIHDDFLLQSKAASLLYHEYAASLPIIDYHNHLNPTDLVNDQQFENLTQLWITPDPYKHRAMRICGVPENNITGNTSDKEKYLQWANTVPKTLGNPLYHWNALELKRIFGIDTLLNAETAKEIWENCNAQLTTGNHSAIQLLQQWKVEALCTSDDLLDNLIPHQTATEKYNIKVFPSLRGDAILKIAQTDWRDRLSQSTLTTIHNLADYKTAISKRLDIFREAGCLLADHALDAGFQFNLPTESIANQFFEKVLAGEKLNSSERVKLDSYLLFHLGQEYASRGWVMQLHVGAQRFTSSRLRKLAGSSGGYGAIGKNTDINSLVTLLNELEKQAALPKVILYNLNPIDNEAFASITGSFAEDGVVAKIQFGPAWWYNDHYNGIRNQLIALADYGLLSQFIGMTTDSRSLLSFSRHEYFRRTLCNLLGDWVEQGYIPNDQELLKMTIENICYHNAKRWLAIQQDIYATATIEG